MGTSPGFMKKTCHWIKAMTIVLKNQRRFKGGIMQTVKASEFKAKCLHFMDEVNETGEGIVITKNGKPVFILKPYRTVPSTLFGLHTGTVESKDDLIAPSGIENVVTLMMSDEKNSLVEPIPPKN